MDIKELGRFLLLLQQKVLFKMPSKDSFTGLQIKKKEPGGERGDFTLLYQLYFHIFVKKTGP